MSTAQDSSFRLPLFEVLEPRLLLSGVEESGQAILQGLYTWEFSLDIGSDTELSDPFMDGDEGFDPGDVYSWQSGPVIPPQVQGGRDGFKDDATIFGSSGFDPWPDPPDPHYATVVPVGEGGPENYGDYFDLDGHDELDSSLWEAQLPIGQIPIWRDEMFVSPYVYAPEFLAVSFDDDTAPGWPDPGAVPVTSFSPFMNRAYGTSAYDDEIWGVTLAPAPPGGPSPITDQYGIADEPTVHPDLLPGPDQPEDDDDVDSLDIVPDDADTPYWYFTADHEAHLGLDPAAIYEVTGLSGPVPVIQPWMLGLNLDKDGADVDAFESAWLPYEDLDGASGAGTMQHQEVLGVIFSVDDDDPLTPMDESGGLDPTMIYGSYLLGYNFPLLEEPLQDDIDAITLRHEFLKSAELDFGDAPDSTVALGYPTLLINNGANHVIGGPWLGDNTDKPDAEPDGQPDASATGDDLDITSPTANDDEDGVSIPVLTVGQSDNIMVEVNDGGTGTGGVLEAWIDFNGDKIWQGSELIHSAWLPAGTHTIPVTPPAGSVVGQTFGRFRVSLGGALAPTGAAHDGEVEDHRVWIEEPPPELDWGDAPEIAGAMGYPTTAINNGANHVIGGPWLGDDTDKPDAEPDGQPDANATGDDLDITSPIPNDDEDGVAVSPLAPGQSGAVIVTINDGAGGAGAGGAFLDAWIDFNGDKTWQAAEQIYSGWLPHGPNVLTFAVPAGAVIGQTFGRFRVNSRQAGLAPTGAAVDGEVEDHKFSIHELPDNAKWVQWPDLTPYGIDIKVDGQEPQRVLADDFLCAETSLLTDVHLWGSWLNDIVGDIANVHLSIHEDDPVGDGGMRPDNKWSMPGQLLWEGDFDNYGMTPFYELSEGFEWWWDPITGNLIPDGDRQVWQIDVQIDPANAFIQRGTPDEPVIYWLDVDVDVKPDQSGGRQPEFGWKTRQWPDHYMDDAVWWNGLGWQDLHYPPGHPYEGLERDSIDMAFMLTFEELPPELDFGNAPDVAGTVGYPTLLANNGARHIIGSGLYLGAGVDSEPDGQPDANALGDDNDTIYPPANDDEDGVTFLSQFVAGREARVRVVASGPGVLNAWFDWAGDSSWNEFGDHVLVDVTIPAGGTIFNINVPAGATISETFTRFRLDSAGGLSPTGLAGNGEVEDYKVEIVEEPTLVKWDQPPDPANPDNLFYGWNEPSVYDSRQIAADDWVCANADPVAGVTWWGSFSGWTESDLPDLMTMPASFNLAIWTDMTANDPRNQYSFSHPDQVQWVYDTSLGYTAEFVGWDYDPRTESYEACFRFHADIPERYWYYQPGPENILWLSIAALQQEPIYEWGWKTRPRDHTSPAPDDAVRILVPTSGLVPGSLFQSGQEITWPTPADSWDLAFELHSVNYPAGTKWDQPPDLNGMDILDGPYWNAAQGMAYEKFLADDFRCTQTGPITEVRIRSSYLFDEWMDFPPLFNLAIYSDIPAGAASYSMPGNVLWEAYLPAVSEEIIGQGDERYYDPNTGDIIGLDRDVYEYTFLIPEDEAIVQEEGNIYWLGVGHSFDLDGSTTVDGEDEGMLQEFHWAYGWKTAETQRYDGAVWTDVNSLGSSGDIPAPTGAWRLLEPFGVITDLSFTIITTQEPVPYVKWSQPPEPYNPPNAFNGWDEFSVYGPNSPQIVADDWLCDTSDPVTDVHWLGSFIGWDNGQELPGILPEAFHFGIWNDMPADPADPLDWSRPDLLLWEHMCYDFEMSFVGWDIDPRGDGLVVPEATFAFSQDLPEKDWFWQEDGDNVYWISIAAVYPDDIVLPEYAFGWKTRPRDPKSPAPDDAVRVFAPTAPSLGKQFQLGEPIEFPEGVSWDMVFALTSKDRTPPQVTNVAVGGTGWTNAPYDVPVGSNAQFDTLPWGNVDQVSISFSEWVSVGPEDLDLVGAPGYTVTGLAYDILTNTATFTLAQALQPGTVMLDLTDAVIDASGNRLDGDWTDTVSVYPSGDTVTGANFQFTVKALPGDTDQNGTVGASDYMALKRNLGTPSGATAATGDLDGDGDVDWYDLQILRAYYGSVVPTPPAIPMGGGESVGQTTPEKLLSPVVTPVASSAAANGLDGARAAAALDAADPLRAFVRARHRNAATLPVTTPKPRRRAARRRQFEALLGRSRLLRVAQESVRQVGPASGIEEAPAEVGADLLDVILLSKPLRLDPIGLDALAIRI